ncbi:MAG TPA: hypothetical protein VMW83_10150 [Spirochaetia bacterium]|nr:hypothetical protein [Spirochaetia bacterium]
MLTVKLRNALSTLGVPFAFSIVYILVVAHQMITDGDPFWAMAAGKWIVAHHTVPHTDPFSWTAFGKPWVAHEWAYDVILYLFSSWMGYYGLMLLTWLGLAGFLVFVWLLCRKEEKSAAVTVVIFSITAFFPRSLIVARPQVCSYFLFVVFLYVLAWHSRSKWRWTLPVLTLLWANLHSSVVLGVLMVAFEAGMQWYHERDGGLLPVAGASFLASLLNPNSLSLWKFAFWLSGNSWNRDITEWQPPDFRSPIMAMIYLLPIFMLAVTLYGRKKENYWDAAGRRRFTVLALYLTGFFYLAITGGRYYPYFVVVWGIMILRLLPDEFLARVKGKNVQVAFALIGAVVLIYSLFNFPQKDVMREVSGGGWPAGALSYIKSHDLQDHLFNNYTWGGYLIYEGVSPFIDGRDDIYLASTQVFQDYLQAVRLNVNPDGVLDKYRIRTVLMPKDSPLVRYLEAEPQKWKEVYRDTVGDVFVSAPRGGRLRRS